MKNINFKSLTPHIVAILLFVILAGSYVTPIFSGKQLKQSDVTQYQGMSKEINDYREKTGQEALWTNRMFCGMPAYQISILYSSNLVKYIDKILMLGLPYIMGLIFLYFLGFYILLISMRVNPWTSLIGAIAFAGSSFFLIILDVGHNTQAHAIGYIAPVIAGVILTYRGKYLLGGILTALFMALELNCNHLQITYYMGLTIAVLVIYEFFNQLKKFKSFIVASVIVGGAFILAAGTSFTNMWATSEYGKYTTRGKSELTFDKENKTSGLDRDYATDWSYGKMETFTLLIPNYMGGSSSGDLSKSSDTYNALIDHNVPVKTAEKYIKGLPLYWGPQDTTSGPVYVGAIIVFLFILGLIVVKGKYKWWLLTATLLSIFLAWGKNLMWFTNLFFDYIPGYDKFRAVTMTLVIAEFCMPLLGVLALKEMFDPEVPKADKMKALKISGIVTLGLLVIFGFFSGAYFDFVGSSDESMVSAGYPDWLVTAIQSDRHGLVMMDTLRSLIYIGLAFVFILLFVMEKIKKLWIIISALAFLVMLDMYTVGKRYLKDENFVTKNKMKSIFTKSKADEYILTDTAKDYRVLSLANPFNDAMTSYYHNSIGGYHGAKLKRYQELIQYRLTEEITGIKAAFSAKSPDSALAVTMKKLPVLNMLNTKYMIYSDDYPPLPNTKNALGNAWFVENYKLVANADSEITAIKDFDPATTAIVDERFKDYVGKLNPGKDSSASIELISVTPNDLKYSSVSTKEGLAVFSEIYYDKGWDAYIDGKKSDYIRVNYVLRAMIIPAGTHAIEWKFEPAVYYTGEKISLAFNILLIIVVVGGLFFEFRKKNDQKEAA